MSFIAPMALAGSFAAGLLVDRMADRFVLAMALTLLVVAVIWPNYFGRVALGSIRGVASTAMVASAALGPLPFGYLVTLSGNYNVARLVCATLPLLCVVTSLMAVAPTRPRTRETGARARA